MRRSLIILAAVTSLTLTAASVLADDLEPPGWRDNDNAEDNRSTYQRWEFETPDDGIGSLTGLLPDSPYTNPQFDPLNPVNAPLGAIIMPKDGDDWRDELNGRTGVWPLSGTISIQIPNYSDGPEKTIWIQLTWMPQIQDAVPEIIAMTNYQPFVPAGDPLIEQPAGPADTDWIHSTYLITVQPNPEFEMISISGDIYVDEMVIDTICPEPATMVLLGLAVPFVLKRRSRK